MDFEEDRPANLRHECSNGIFSLFEEGIRHAAQPCACGHARLKQMPFLIEQGKGNLSKPVRLYAQLAIDSARSIDSLFTTV